MFIYLITNFTKYLITNFTKYLITNFTKYLIIHVYLFSKHRKTSNYFHLTNIFYHPKYSELFPLILS
jgi:hypothetical protein